MALSLSPMAPKKPAKKKPVTLQMEQQAVAKPVALQPTPVAPTTPVARTPAAPTPPREMIPAGMGSNSIITQPVPVGPMYRGNARQPIQAIKTPTPSPAAGGSGGLGGGAAVVAEQKPTQFAGGAAGAGGAGGAAAGAVAGGAGGTGVSGVPAGFQDEDAYGPKGYKPSKPVEPFPRAEEKPASNEELNAQIRSLMEDLVSGRGMDVNTAEEEALIRELMQDRLGQGLVEQRAKMGRAGFGASGALAAMEGDVRRQAGQQVTQETLALRRQAEQEAIRNALQAVGVDIDVRGEARKAAFDEEFLNALKASLGLDGGEGDGGGGGGGGLSVRTDIGGLTTGWGDSPTLAASGQGDAGMDSNNPIVTQSAPSGSRLIQDSADVGGKLYLGPDGLYYLVEA